MKLVYIAYGYGLAMLHRSLIDYRFDNVEAWKYGPVIPSVYHSFKYYRDRPIKDKTIVIEGDEDQQIKFVEPQLTDRDAQMICDYVWDRYNSYSDSQLVSLLHAQATPWGQVYEEGKNNPIPEILTKDYYSRLVRRLLAVAEHGQK